MKVILPVAGRGTRLRPHTHAKAKSLVRVAGKTVLEHIITRLEAIEVEEYIFIVDDNGTQIEDFMREHFPALKCTYIPQHEKLGPAHAVYLGAERINPGDDVLVVFNDTIFITDLTRIDELCRDCDGLIYSHEVEDYQRFGVNVVRDGYIVDMVEKPDQPISRLAQVGLYYLKDACDFMEYLARSIEAGEKEKGEFYLPAVFMRMIKDGKKLRAPSIEAWLDCGKPENLLETNRYLLRESNRCEGEMHNSVIIEPVFIGRGARVSNSVIGPDVSIARGSVVEQAVISDTIINADSEVNNVVLRHSIFGDAVRLVGSAQSMNMGDHSEVETRS
jgi:glucose-1-phosphate thymidylyltransferase